MRQGEREREAGWKDIAGNRVGLDRQQCWLNVWGKCCCLLEARERLSVRMYCMCVWVGGCVCVFHIPRQHSSRGPDKSGHI